MNDMYASLVEAIILQAVLDYQGVRNIPKHRKIIKAISEQIDENADENAIDVERLEARLKSRKKMLSEIQKNAEDAERFFNSKWFDALADMIGVKPEVVRKALVAGKLPEKVRLT